jgi:hypothetical protein
MTLVELLVSLAVAAMAAVAAMTVTVSLARSEAALRREADRADRFAPALENVVRMDLEHAHHWKAVPGGFALRTNVRLNAGDLEVEHVPAAVTYAVREAGGRRALVRTQETPPEPPRTELVAMDADAIMLAPARQVRPGPDGWAPLAGNATVTVTTGGVPIEIRLLREGGDRP